MRMLFAAMHESVIDPKQKPPGRAAGAAYWGGPAAVRGHHWITSLPRVSGIGGTARPSAFAVLR